jgi:hypothetical protein
VTAFKANMDCDNAAFDMPGYEIARLLETAAEQLRNGEDCGCFVDINGNTVGGWEIEGLEEEDE